MLIFANSHNFIGSMRPWRGMHSHNIVEKVKNTPPHFCKILAISLLCD